MTRCSVSQARTRWGQLIARAWTGEDIEITVFDQPYVVLTREMPADAGAPPLRCLIEKARSNWSQLLSTVANDDARFSFATDGGEVYLCKSPEFNNPFTEQWQLHAAAQAQPLSRERIAGALKALTTVQRELRSLQKRMDALVNVAHVALESLPEDDNND